MQQKNISIEAFRFIFMVILCLTHIEGSIHTQYHGYLVVEFFFMISGVFLYRTYLNHSDIGVLDYLIHRIKRLLPEYILAIIPFYIIWHRGLFERSTIGAENIFEQYYGFLLKLLTDTFLISDGITWYVSDLLFGGCIIYSILRNFKTSATSLLIPVGCLMIYCYFFPRYENVSIERWNSINAFSMPMLRALADMGMGVLLYHVMLRKPESFRNHNKLVNMASIIGLIIVLLMMLFKIQKDAYVTVFMPLFIMGLFSTNSWWNRLFKSKIWLFLGSLSYEMLLVHLILRGPIIKFEMGQWMNPWILGITYLISVVLLSFILMEAGKRLRKQLGW